MVPPGDSLVDQIVRRLRENEVLEEEDFSTFVVRSSIDGIYTYDLDRIITLWNPAMERITGIRRERALGRDIFEVAPHLKEFGLEHLILGPLEGRTVEEAEIPFYVKETGRRGFVGRVSCPLRNDSGQVVGGLCFVHEITDRKEAREKVVVRRLAEERLRFLSSAGMLLSGTLDYEEVLSRIINLSTKHFSSWVKLRLLNEDGSIRVITGHEDAELNEKLNEIEKQYPPSEDLKEGPLWILRHGGHQFFKCFTKQQLDVYAKDENHRRLLSHLHGYICVPLMQRGRILGTFSLLGTRRDFTDEDLALAFDLSRWVALALDNARLYQEAKRRGRKS